MTLTGIKEIKGKIILKSGLHIGSGDTEMHIGGTDDPVARHPHTGEPYIPGSSIKGKVRSLLEMKAGLMMVTEGKPVQASQLGSFAGDRRNECMKILKLFGTGAADNESIEDLGPTRLSFADCYLNDEWKKEARKNRWSFFETKSENTIDRIHGNALHPRIMERVPRGAEFDFVVTMKILGENEETELFDYLLDGLKLLSVDALGGSGSRGYGRIEFEFENPALNERFKTIQPFQS